MLERTHVSLKRALKLEIDETRSMWQKYGNIAVLNYNTSYHTINGCKPSRVFNRRVRHNVLDLKKGIRPQIKPTPNSQIDNLQTMLSNKKKSFPKMSIRTTCKRTLSIKRIMTRKLMPRNWKTNKLCMFNSVTQITKEGKFLLQTVDE